MSHWTGQVTFRSAIAFDPCAGTWSKLPDMPSHRSGAISVVCGNQWILAGGTDGDTRVASTVAFDFEGETWSTLPDMPGEGREFASAGAIGGCIIVGGGDTGSPMSSKELSSCCMFSPQTKTWTELPDMPTKRSQAFSAVLGDEKFVIVGGEDRTDAVAFSLATKVWEKLPDWPTPSRTAATACSCEGNTPGLGSSGGALFIVGGLFPDGFNSYPQKATASVVRFDLDSGWTTLPDMPEARAMAACVVAGGGLLVVGGFSEQKSAATTFRFDFGKGTWSTLEEMPVARRSADLFAIPAHAE